MSRPVLHFWEASPAARICQLVIRYLDLDVEIRSRSYSDHKTEEFFKLNPSQKIPVLQDGDFTLSESLAICQYLIEKNGSQDKLLGKTLKDRAVVMHRLCFNLATVFVKLYDLTQPLYDGTTKEYDTQKLQDCLKMLTELDFYLGEHRWAAADYVTLADLAILTMVASCRHCGFDLAPFKNISQWYKKCETLPGFAENEDGAKRLGKDLKEFMTK
ncbi:glutathione S-transferase 1-1-like [Culicoides brevitarsis]|uniref:glutathione S-transferase 1-1-like n=1 Tax=Culicoides brevitarsis TaxID=469753 RepID=UPI00307B2A65